MSSASPSFGSNNPFRRKTGGPSPSSAIPSGSPAPSSSLDNPTLSSAPRPPVTTFRTAVSEHQDSRDDPIQTKPKKIVKKVRVQSPPPSSPEDAVPVTTYFPPADYDDDDDDDGYDDADSRNSRNTISEGDGLDPFSGGQTEEEEDEARTETSDEHTLPRAPPNPFSRTPGDLEQSIPGEEANSAPGSKGALDVNSFKRLLLTGHADNPGAAGAAGGTSLSGPTNTWSGSSPLPTPSHDGASVTDASSVSRQSVVDAIQDTPRTSHEISEPEEAGERRSSHLTSPLANIQPTSGRKKPPPPSSRHGKLIKIELGSEQRPGTPSRDSGVGVSLDTDVQPTGQQSPLSASSDVNKPLPLPPTRTPADEQTESPFDREAAGKLPEAFSDAAVAANSGPSKPSDGTRSRSESQVSTGTTSSVRKPAAPPPRRHGRSDSKPPSIMANPADEEAPRSSMESNRSRADSLRIGSSANAGLAAPVPPPPRRPSHNRSGSSITSPTSVSSPGSIDGVRLSQGTGFSLFEHPNYGSGLATVTTTKDGMPKLSPPPPPPARQSSARRPPSISSLESGSRKVSREKDGAIAAPPPPPRRTRSNKSSMGNAEAIRSDSESRSASGGLERVDGESPKSLATSEATNIGTGVDILKDLEALQNEVKAAMGRS
ncbi:hypothetical protein PG993_009430 [Apiospora rasikravindrae]|uniref:DZF domain-containing protein n=1 Tax=Apiospora rasikravindrae TaxID=990691 RepID=A0ABR1SJD5_9PEZI